MGDVVVGTCGWTERTMVEAWYPHEAKTAEQRLRYYAAHFGSVEVDSTFYAIPRIETVSDWARRTPPGFAFHVKAYGLLTGHEVEERALHPDLRDDGYRYDVTMHGRVRNPDERLVSRGFEIFRETLEPLLEADRMGGVLMQYPPWFTASNKEHRERNLGRIALAAEYLDPIPVFVEFRHSSWMAPANRRRTLEFLASQNMSYVAVDEPWIPASHTMPPVAYSTGRLGYARFHGRNARMWGKRTSSAADRFDYLYSPDELAEWRTRLLGLAADTDRTWVMFNNCKYDYAPRNAADMAAILSDVTAPIPQYESVGETVTSQPAEEPGDWVAETLF